MAEAEAGDFEAFPSVTAEAWAARVERESKAKPEQLSTKLEDGRLQRPLYTEVDVRPGLGRGSPARAHAPEVWARVRGPDLEAANRTLLADLAGGASGLLLAFDGPGALNVEAAADFATLLEDVQLSAITLAFEPTARRRTLASLFSSYTEGAEIPKAELSVHFGFDALGAVTRFGGTRGTLATHFDDAAWALRELAPAFPKARILELSTECVHEAGASADFELACLASALVATLRALEARSVLPETTARQLRLTLPLEADFMLGLIKLRAARTLVHRVLELSGVPAPHRVPPLLASSSRRALTTFDPFVNVLRGTSASFAALTGGADFVEIAPYDERNTRPSEAARRLARNTTHVLTHEAQLARVTDPAGGSYFFEAETRAMAESAWASFKAMETEGGYEELLFRGQIALVAGANHFEQSRLVQSRKRALTGITEFVDLSPPNTSPAPVATSTRPSPALEPHHLAEPFETLRAAAEAFRGRAGHLPAVQLLTLGEPAEHEARSTWVTNLLAAGGLVATQEAQPVVIVSGADARYESEAAPLAQRLRESGKLRHLALAGKPKHETAFRLAGYDSFIFRGEDVVAFLSELQRALGVIA